MALGGPVGIEEILCSGHALLNNHSPAHRCIPRLLKLRKRAQLGLSV
jgi:hypothetical protein